jgi:hypothetical protein
VEVFYTSSTRVWGGPIPLSIWFQFPDSYTEKFALGSGSGYFASDGQSASLSWCRALIWGPFPYFYYSQILHVEGRPPWREDGSVIYSYNLLSFSHPSPGELLATSYSLNWDHILLPHTRLSNLEGQDPVFIFPNNKVAQLYPRALGSRFLASYDSKGYGGGILTRLHTGLHVVSVTDP